MGMNPETNKIEQLTEAEKKFIDEMPRRDFSNQSIAEILTQGASKEKSTVLLRPDGTPVPEHWTVLKVGELVNIKNYTFKVGYIGESALLLEPYGPVLLDNGSSK